MGKSTDVYANNLEISGKATKNKSLAAMPDVCLSPPAPPAGPIPIPYPNTSFASDTNAGTRRTRIGKKEVGMKNQSKYKKSTGNEPATRNFGMGVVTHKIQGPMRFGAWSMDVKFEGANVTRFMDLTTHNHGNPSNGGIQSSIAGMTTATPETTCQELSDSNTTARQDLKSGRHGIQKPGNKSLIQASDATTTITHARYTVNGTTSLMKGCSKQVVHQYDNAWSAGLSSDELDTQTDKTDGKVKSRVCGGGFKYPKRKQRPLSSHTEARMLEDIFRTHPTGGGNLLLMINWPSAPVRRTPESPCDDCLKLICHATQCMDIFVCRVRKAKDQNGNKVDVKEPVDAKTMCGKDMKKKGKSP